MTRKITISLEDSVYEYLVAKTNNRSAYINDLIAQQQQIEADKLLEQAYIDRENDPEFHYEKQLWECTVGDGLEDA
ncbi:MAG: hypothetical protein QNJ72_16080 [Pleurocapsa sp. MO_226.B13]|nr:hypothetical protein [Pleurocapsa sp. MO_226.B13]